MERILRPLAGAIFGAGLASLASAATPHAPSFGPEVLILFGVKVPIFSALCGLIGVILARQVAPASAAGVLLGRRGNIALTGLLALGVLALIVSGQKQPLVAVAWAIGLGHSGLGFIELVARSVVTGSRLFLDAFIRASTAAGAAWADRKGQDIDP
jgi:hypothetical protein